jgi:hypothetical protein
LADADECTVGVVELAVNSQIKLVERKRAGIDYVELGKDGVIVLYCKCGGLPVVLKVREPEDSVFSQGATKSETRLLPREKWVWMVEVSTKARIGGHIVISIEKERRTVETIGAMASNDVDSASAAHR